jgi:hypothetical protein
VSRKLGSNMTNRMSGKRVPQGQAHASLAPSEPRGSFLVSAPHRVATEPGDPRPWKPYGVAHARKVGSLETACGLSAVGWRFFWTQPFRAGDPQACPECRSAIAGQI